jgi:signal transduction histidine kinase
MRLVRNLSIRHKLLAFSLLTSGVVLALAFAAFVSRDIGFRRDSLERELLAIGEITGRNVIAAVLFEDQEDALATLASLGVKPYLHLRWARLYRPDGSEFATQTFSVAANRIVDRGCVEQPRGDLAIGTAYVVMGDGGAPHASLCKALVMDGDVVGTLQIVADLRQFNDEIAAYIILASIVTMVLLLLAIVMSWGLQRLISNPVLRLSRTMQRVASERDYSVRVAKQGDDEIGALIDCFHEMLSRIERHEASLTKARLEAEAASRAKSAFLATMSHELRTPLNAILGFSEIMTLETFGPLGSQNYRDYSRDIYDSGLHLLHVVNDVLDLSKIEAGRLDLNRTDIDVGQVVQAALRFFRERSQRAGLTLTAQIDPCLPPLHADDRIVRQCILNLIANAIKFTPANGAVVVAAHGEAGDWTAISIADNGIGISEADLPKVVTPFGQAGNAYTRKHDGTGLGLPLVKSFVELHRGTFDIKSAVGAGTTVTIRFPPRPSVDAGQTDAGEGPAARAAASAQPIAGAAATSQSAPRPATSLVRAERR